MSSFQIPDVAVADRGVEIVPLGHQVNLLDSETGFLSSVTVEALRVFLVIADNLAVSGHEFFSQLRIVLEEVSAHGDDNGGIKETLTGGENLGSLIGHFQSRRAGKKTGVSTAAGEGSSGLRYTHRYKFYIVDGESFTLQCSNEELVKNGSLGTGNGFSLQVFDGADIGIFGDDVEGLRCPAVDADNLQVNTVGSGKDSTGTAKGMADINLTGGHCLCLLGSGIKVTVFYGYAVCFEGILKYIAALFDDGGNVQRGFYIGEV